MSWKTKRKKSVYDAINANTNGHADEILNLTPGYCHVQNLDVIASWLLDYCKDSNIQITAYRGLL